MYIRQSMLLNQKENYEFSTAVIDSVKSIFDLYIDTQ
jgi:hypothetical protein